MIVLCLTSGTWRGDWEEVVDCRDREDGMGWRERGTSEQEQNRGRETSKRERERERERERPVMVQTTQYTLTKTHSKSKSHVGYLERDLVKDFTKDPMNLGLHNLGSI